MENTPSQSQKTFFDSSFIAPPLSESARDHDHDQLLSSVTAVISTNDFQFGSPGEVFTLRLHKLESGKIKLVLQKQLTICDFKTWTSMKYVFKSVPEVTNVISGIFMLLLDNPSKISAPDWQMNLSGLVGSLRRQRESESVARTNHSELMKGTFTNHTVLIDMLKRNEARPKWFEGRLKLWQNNQEISTNSINILRQFYCQVRPDIFFLVAETAQKTLRQRLLEETPAPSPEVIVGFLEGIAKGLKRFHDHNTIHGGLSPDNIGIVRDCTGREIAKLAYSYSSCVIQNPEENFPGWPYTHKVTMLIENRVVAAAAEIKNVSESKSLDIFMFGQTARFALHPTDGTVLIQNEEVDILNRYGVTGNNFLQWITQTDSKALPDIDEILAHPIFYTPGKSLKFITDIVNFSKRDDPFWEAMNLAYKRYREEIDGDGTLILDWKKSVTPLIFEGHRKKYVGDSLRSLDELIRDKNQHVLHLSRSLLEEQYFGNKEGYFCEDKFSQYFLKLFPDTVISLFCMMLCYDNNFDCDEENVNLSGAMHKYFEHFQSFKLKIMHGPITTWIF